MNKLTITLLLIVLTSIVFAQDVQTTQDTLRKDALRVFMEADDYIKREIPFINYVRDLQEAQLYIISTSERTGSGGRNYTYFLVGQNEFGDMSDTISVATSPDDTQDQVRQKQVLMLKMGLMRYVARTPLAVHFNINFTQPVEEVVSTDKWKSWVFNSRINGFFNGQKTYKYSDYYGSFSASRVTQDWKVIFDLSFSHGDEKFTIDEDIITSINKSKSLEGLIVKSITEHLSIGGSAEAGSSTYRNKKAYLQVMPGIEFNVFPYSESTRKQFRFLYSAGYVYNDYYETTVYDKLNEGLWKHSLDATYTVIQKWGSINIGTEWSNYFHDWSLNNLSLSGNMEFRITKGLRFNIGGGASLIHDQISLVKGGASAEEILTRQKELETQYSYFTSFGISYTFGSIFNNVVNPRFGNGGGRNMIIIM